MTEPAEIAPTAEPVSAGVWHWRIANANIGGAISSSQLVARDGDAVLVDPVRLSPDALAGLPRPTVICLTAKCHQRASWRYRRELEAPVWMPEGAPPADEEPDNRYREGDVLPGGLVAVRTPGPEPVHYSFLLPSPHGVLLCSDLLENTPGRGLDFVPPQYHDDPAETRRSVEHLLGLDFEILCLDHGAPILDDPKTRIRVLLDRTA